MQTPDLPAWWVPTLIYIVNFRILFPQQVGMRSCWILKLRGEVGFQNPHVASSSRVQLLTHSLYPVSSLVSEFGRMHVSASCSLLTNAAVQRSLSCRKTCQFSCRRQLSSTPRLQHESRPAKSESSNNNHPNCCAHIYFADASKHCMLGTAKKYKKRENNI